MTRVRHLALVALAAALLIGMLPGFPQAARAARWELASRTAYEVQPDDRRVEVRVRVIFRNTTPNPPGRFSIFEVIDLAVQRGATEIEARDGRGPLRVTTQRKRNAVKVSVRPREGVRYRERTRFTLSYRLPDGAPGVRVRPSVVTFPVWAFGTRGSAAVMLPGRFEVSVDGEELVPERTAGGWRLESGEVRDPQSWLSLILAVGAAGHDTVTGAVPLASGTVDLQVRAWRDDGAWGRRTLDLVSEALPMIERELGMPYPGAAALVVEEAVAQPRAGLPEGASEGAHLLAGYDQPAFALLHQLGHVWLSDELVADRWISEGFASWAAGRAAGELDARPPYRPAERADDLRDDAFPLISWGAGEATPAQDAYAYAAAWAVAERVANRVGAEDLRRAWLRIAAGSDAYAPVTDAQPALDAPAADRRPLDSRALLDHLEAVSGERLDELFATWVFDEGTAALLPERTEAKAEFAALLEAAGDWGAPQPVIVDLAAWRFDVARRRIAETMDWLRDRDVLVDLAGRAGLAVPERLRDRYRTAGGGPDARAELDAERAVVDDYIEALGIASAGRDMLDRIGLLGAADSDALLREANQLFAEGDLRGAADATHQVLSQLESARTQGIVRIAAIGVLVLVLLALAIGLMRRRGSGATTNYTAAP